MRLRIYIISVVALVGFSISGMACGIGGEDPKDYLLFRVFDSSINMIDWEVDQLEDSPDPEVQKYLKLARDCEKLRYFRDSKWYYPTKEVDVVHCSLEEVLAEALAYKGSKLWDRYALQAARAMFSLGKFREMREWWTKTEGRIKDEKIRKNIEGYVAGAMYRTGDEEKALEYYTSIGDISSIIYWLKNKGDYAGD